MDKLKGKNIMKNYINFIQILLAVFVVSVSANDKTLNAGAFIEFGSIVNGENFQEEGVVESIDNQILQRSLVYFAFQGKLTPKTTVNLNFALLLFRTIAGENEEDAFDRFNLSGAGIGASGLLHHFSDNLEIEIGLLEYKYTKSRNLGEYLLKSEAYPTVIRTGGLTILNFSHYRALGVRLSWNLLNGFVTNDFLFFSSYDQVPVFDVSPSWIGSINPNPGIKIGVGISLHRLIAANNDITNPTYDPLTKSGGGTNIFDNLKVKRLVQSQVSISYVTQNVLGIPENQNGTYFYEGDLDSATIFADLRVLDASANSLVIDRTSLKETDNLKENFSGSLAELFGEEVCENGLQSSLTCKPYYAVVNGGEVIRSLNSNGKFEENVLEYNDRFNLTFKATKIVGFFHLNLNYLLGFPLEKTGVFSIHGEAALLGVKNFEGIYDNRIERTPITVGFDVPTFEILDILSFEVEYLRNSQLDSEREILKGLPLPTLQDLVTPNTKRDNWKWTLYMKRKIYHNIDGFLQVSNDHLRVPERKVTPTYIPITNNPTHWYWVARLNWSI